MNKALTFTVIFSGTLFSVFLLNIILYALVPGYHDALNSAVTTKEEIPVVEVDRSVIEKREAKVMDVTKDRTEEYAFEELLDDDVPMAASAEDTAKAACESNTATALSIIDKEYHEDCGTGDGYWVITYSDGSVGIE